MYVQSSDTAGLSAIEKEMACHYRALSPQEFRPKHITWNFSRVTTRG
jgi:hypothetical protein